MSPNPPRNNKYGGQVPVTLVGQALVASSLIDITGELAHWNVTLSPLIRPDGTPIAGAPLFATVNHTATVQWGHGGMQDTAVLDWPMRGGTFQVAGSSVNVFGSCLLQGLFTSAGSNQVPDVQFRAHAARADAGPRMKMQSPTRTLFFGNVPGFTTTPAQRIPAFAKRFWIQASDGNNTIVVFAHWQDHGNVPATIRRDTWQRNNAAGGAQAYYDVAWMVPPTAMWLVIENPNAAQASELQVVFELDLG